VADAHLNHFELHISKDRAELWASDYDDPKSLKLRATVEHLDLTFTHGYVHFQHGQYNATKDGLDGCESGGGDVTKCPTRSQTFRWDNIGFDGPVYPTPRAFDVQNNTLEKADGVQIGWYINDGQVHSFDVDDVKIDGGLSASFNFNTNLQQGEEIQYRFNGKAWHSFQVVVTHDKSYDGESLRGFSLPAPLAELVNGKNVIEVQLPKPAGSEGIGNMDITVEAQ
jgi:hypothetical protein